VRRRQHRLGDLRRLRQVIDREVRTRTRAFVNLSAIGIIFDCAHGRNHFSFAMIEKALDQGFLPDTISTDLTFTSATSGPVWDLTTTMSKLCISACRSRNWCGGPPRMPAKIPRL